LRRRRQHFSRFADAASHARSAGCWRAACASRSARRGAAARAGADEEEGGFYEGAQNEPPPLNEAALAESSDAANEDLLVFFYGQELEQRLQRALNNEQYDTAQTLRKKLEVMNASLRQAADAKRAGGGRASRADAEAELTARQARVAVLKSQMAAAVVEERYRDAAALRDQLATAELAALTAAASAAGAAAPGEGGEPAFALGQRVESRRHGWCGVVCGIEPRCGESDAWAAEAGVEALPRGREQPFYLVLPDVDALGVAAVLYCAEEALQLPPPLPRGAAQPEPIEHPYTYLLFLGPDAAGGYVPSRALREKYSAPRRDVHAPDEDEEEEPEEGDAPPQED
jgi:hemimethylated DNA binding protein